MITKTMRKYLENYSSEEVKDGKEKIKHCVYMNRIQKRIDKEMKSMVWLAINYPHVFEDKHNKRLRSLMLVIKAIKPKMNVQLVMDNLNIPDDLKDKPKVPNLPS